MSILEPDAKELAQGMAGKVSDELLACGPALLSIAISLRRIADALAGPEDCGKMGILDVMYAEYERNI